MSTFLGENSLIPQPTVVGRDAVLAELQGDVDALAKLEKLAELQKQQVRQTLKGEVAQGIQQLISLPDIINTLVTQLETEILKFKQTAIETNQAYRAIQQPPELTAMGWNKPRVHRGKPPSIWQVHFSDIPTVVKQRAVFVLTAKIVDLFQAERERRPKTSRSSTAPQKSIRKLALQTAAVLKSTVPNL